MKKILLFSMALLTTLAFTSCKDNDESTSGNSDGRMNMTMFRTNDNTGAGDTDPYRCQIVNLNTAQLRWYTIDNAYGYRVKWASQGKVSGGQEAWESTEAAGELLGDTVLVGQDQDFLEIQHMTYQTNFMFAIQVLHSADLNDPQNSKWYGYGNGREWAEYLGMTTSARYEVPTVIQKSNVSYTSFRVNLDRGFVKQDGESAKYTVDQLAGFKDHGFYTPEEEAAGHFKVDWLRIQASPSTPTANVPSRFSHYELTDADWSRGYVDIEGLDSNSVYVIDVVRNDIPYSVDNTYNSLSARTKGTPGAPILITHVVSDTTVLDANGNVSYSPEIFKQYQAMYLDSIVTSYMRSMTIAENQVFYLEGGKHYLFMGNQTLYKGVTFMTNPQDIADGKGKATIYLGGLNRPAGAANSTNFMFGRTPETGENSTIPIDVDVLHFKDLIIDCPQAITYGEKQVNSSVTGATGNYFANMYSTGMGVNINQLHLENCEFHNLVRGFIRTQGSNQKIFKQILIEGCEFFNLGHYDNKGGGYNWIHGQGTQTSSNVFNDVIFRNNTWFNSPKGALVTNGNESLTFDEDIRYNITIENNTFVNFQPGSGASALMGIRYVPGGSKFTIKNNLFILTKRAEDVNRPLNFCGGDLRGAQGGDGSNKVIVDISGNLSTNDNITSTTGQVFTKEPFNSKKYGFLSYADLTDEQIENLKVGVDDISATDLMFQPNPPYDFDATTQYKAYSCSCIDGSQSGEGMVNLYYQNTDKVLGSKIYKNKVGASKWYEGIGKGSAASRRKVGVRW